MTRKAPSLKEYILKALSDKKPKRVKGVIGMLVEAKDFLDVLTVIDGQDKNIPETIQFYEAFFIRFKLNSHLVDGYLTKQEWHDWTVVLLELSNVLWKFREKFEPNPWLETSKRIYEITFGMLKNFEAEKRGLKECKHCSRLFSTALNNFITYAKTGDKEKLHLPSIEELKKVCEKNIGLQWYHLTCGRLLEKKLMLAP